MYGPLLGTPPRAKNFVYHSRQAASCAGEILATKSVFGDLKYVAGFQHYNYQLNSPSPVNQAAITSFFASSSGRTAAGVTLST